LKGEIREKEIPITVHYGLDPIVGGVYLKTGTKSNYITRGRKVSKDHVAIMDTGNSSRSFRPFVEDAGKDNIWFLRKIDGYGKEKVGGGFGIADPEDVQPMSMKGYFLACLSKDPERAVQEYLKKQPKLAQRVEDYLVYAELQRALSIADPNEKAVRLSDYLAPGRKPKGYNGRYDWVLRKHLYKLGAHAVEPLVTILANAVPQHKLDMVVLTLYDIGKEAQSAVPYLLKMLKQDCRTNRYYILSALQTTGDLTVVDSVRPFLASEDLQVRAQAAETLAWVGDIDSFDRIAAAIPRQAKGENSAYVRDMCKALRRLDPVRAEQITREINSEKD